MSTPRERCGILKRYVAREETRSLLTDSVDSNYAIQASFHQAIELRSEMDGGG